VRVYARVLVPPNRYAYIRTAYRCSAPLRNGGSKLRKGAIMAVGARRRCGIKIKQTTGERRVGVRDRDSGGGGFALLLIALIALTLPLLLLPIKVYSMSYLYIAYTVSRVLITCE